MIKLFISFLLIFNTALAEAPRHRTRQNEVTDMFDKDIEDKSSLEQMIENSKVQAEQGISNKESLKTLDLKENKLEGKTMELNSINANSLESAGQQERAKEENAYYDALEIDYTDPKVVNHHKDMDRILSASDRLMGRLLDGLKEHGIDCKTVKGDKEIEPEMYLDIEKEQQKDTVYDQRICEELRNQYSCSDALTLKCTNKSSGEFKPGSIRLSYEEMPAHWWFGISGGNIVQGIGKGTVTFGSTTEILAELRNKIIEKTQAHDVQVPAQEILIFAGQKVLYELDEQGNKGHIQGTWHPNPEGITRSIKFFYRIAQEEKCTSWSEEWSEQCSLK